MGDAKKTGWRAAAPAAVLSFVLCNTPVTGVAGAATPPSWLDLVSQMGQVVNADGPTEAALQAVDASIRDSLNGTTPGYVYTLVSESAQLVLTLKDVTSSAKDVFKDVRTARRYQRAAVTFWKPLYRYYSEWARLEFMAPSPCRLPAGSDMNCKEDLDKLRYYWDNVPNTPGTTTGALKTGLAQTSAASQGAYYNASAALDPLATSVNEALFQARTLEGDAKDYPGNKEVEAVVKVLGEKRVSKFLGKLEVDATHVGTLLRDAGDKMGDCYEYGYTAAQGIAYAPPAGPPADGCS